MKYVKAVFSGEFLFALYLVVGSFKGALNLLFIDETLLLLIITLFVSLKRMYLARFKISKTHIIPIVIFIFILFIVVISILYTPSSNYVYEKLVRFGIIASWCYFGVFFLFRDEESIKRFLMGFVTLSLIMSISLFSNGLTTGIAFQQIFGSSYVALARVSAMGSMILLMYYMNGVGRMKKVIYLLVAMFLAVPLIQSGARLPVILFALVVLSIPLSLVRFKDGDVLISKKLIPFALLFFCIVVASSVFISKGYADTLMYRLDVISSQKGGGNSLIGRTERFETAWEMSKESYFVGKGFGSFPIYYSGLDEEDYPHNIYLEILAELGIVPLILFVSLIVLATFNGFKYYRKRGLNTLNSSIYTIFLFWFFNSFGSSSMTGDKVFYAFIAIMILLPYLSHMSAKEEIPNIYKRERDIGILGDT